MENKKNILGCFVSGPTLTYGENEVVRSNLLKEGDIFRGYIWGENGIDNYLKQLNHLDYGNDIKLILFQFYVKPLPIELTKIEDIEKYRKREKAIGTSIVITDKNFFSKTDRERYDFLKQTVLQKMDLLSEVVKQKNLDTKMEQLKLDVEKKLMTIPNL